MSDAPDREEARAPAPRESATARAAAWILLVAPLLFFVVTARPDLEGSDSAELVAKSYGLGIAHGTGYPLYVSLGRVALLLSPLSPPRTMNLLSALLGGAALALFALAVRELTGRLLVAAIPFVVVAFGRPYWYVSTVAEVYALHHLLLGATLLCLFRWWRTNEFRFLALASFVAALDLGHHGATAFLAPVYVVFVLLHLRGAHRIRKIAVLVALVAVGLSTYAFLPIRMSAAGAAPGGDDTDLKVALGIVERETVGESTAGRVAYKLLGGGPRRKFSWDAETIRENAGRLPEYLRGSMGAALLAAALAGGIGSLLTGRRGPAALLLACAAANTAVFAAFRSLDWEDFMAPTVLMLAAAAALGFGLLVGAARGAPARGAATLLAALVGIGGGVEAHGAASRTLGYSHGQSIVDRERELLALDFPEGAHVCLPWGRASVLRYLQTVEGLRPDLRVHSLSRSAQGAAAERWAGREPVFVEDAGRETRANYRIEPFGTLFRVLPKEGVPADGTAPPR